MAGIKVTDLPVLGAAAADDVFYIVDTSTNTSKQIEVGDILKSGTFTPTISSITPIAVTVPTVSDMIYQRVGNVVTCSFYFEIVFPVGETDVAFNFSLPISSNFTASTDLIGSISHDVADNDTWVTVSANDTLNLGSIFGVGAAETNFNSFVTFQYLIL